MKILQINVFHYPKGGSETVYFNTSKLLQENNHEVVHFALQWHENETSPFASYFPQSKETRTGILKPIKNIINYFYNSEAATKLEQLIIAEKPDLAHIHLIWGQITGSILPVLKRYNIPIACTAHDYRMICPAYTFKNGKDEICEKCKGGKYYQCLLNKCTKKNHLLSAMATCEQYYRNLFFNPAKYIDGIIYVSNFAKEKHEQLMPSLANKPNITLYNTTTQILPNYNQSKSTEQKERYFLSFGRLSNEKGVRTLIQAFEHLPECHLKIAGTGPLEEELKSYVSTTNISNIEFVGFQTGHALQRLISDAYFVIVPSEWYENNPMTIIEAYATAIPVIGSKIGGIPEIINHKTGFLFEHGNVRALEQTIKKANKLTLKEYDTMAYNALEFAQKHFNNKSHYEKLKDFYNKISTIKVL